MFSSAGKISLTILALIIMTKVVNACSLAGDSSDSVDPFVISNFYNKLFLSLSILLVIVTTVTYFLRIRKQLWIVIAAVFCFLISLAISFAILMFHSCGDLVITKYLGGGLFFIVFLFLYQLFSWGIQKKKARFELP